MPTYAYACKNCGNRFDVHQDFTEDSLTHCPQCDGALRKIFSPVGVVFKGSGFYRTDSRDRSRSTSTGSHSHPTSSVSSKDSGSKDSGSSTSASRSSTSTSSTGSPAPSTSAS